MCVIFRTEILNITIKFKRKNVLLMTIEQQPRDRMVIAIQIEFARHFICQNEEKCLINEFIDFWLFTNDS